MDSFQALANAIIEQAVHDYKTSLKKRDRCPDSRECVAEIVSLERFFHSGWFETLTDLDGKLLMGCIRKMVCKEVMG